MSMALFFLGAGGKGRDRAGWEESSTFIGFCRMNNDVQAEVRAG